MIQPCYKHRNLIKTSTHLTFTLGALHRRRKSSRRHITFGNKCVTRTIELWSIKEHTDYIQQEIVFRFFVYKQKCNNNIRLDPPLSSEALCTKTHFVTNNANQFYFMPGCRKSPTPGGSSCNQSASFSKTLDDALHRVSVYTPSSRAIYAYVRSFR